MSMLHNILNPFDNLFKPTPRYLKNPVDRVADSIRTLIMLPFKFLTFFFMFPLLPIIIPIAILYDFFVISINILLFFTIFAAGAIGLSSLLVLTAAEIILPIKIIAIALVSYIALNFINNAIRSLSYKNPFYA